ncbi:class I SAM-dependent methyltransferase [bacterium]
MKKYLHQNVDPDNFDLVSVIDELPLWSAPFGLKLLEMIQLKQDMCVLDIGCGLGFPLIEIAQRLGDSSRVYGIDPWEQALERIRLKCQVYHIQNVETIQGFGEKLPFEDDTFDLIVSNNGITNVQDLPLTLQECGRVSKPNAQLALTYNLEETMIEFYSVLRQVLHDHQLSESISKMEAHIYEKRKPLDEMQSMIQEAGFLIKHISSESFQLRYLDGTAMLNHYFIKFWFLENWKKIVPEENLEIVFEEVETRLNALAQQQDGLQLSIPFVTMDCRSR